MPLLLHAAAAASSRGTQAASDVYAPVSGEVVETNQSLTDKPAAGDPEWSTHGTLRVAVTMGTCNAIGAHAGLIFAFLQPAGALLGKWPEATETGCKGAWCLSEGLQEERLERG
eukprot:1157575-Pelagomonas_calceolata.AAC.4